MTTSTRNTLRLLMPQWQGGNAPVYHLGARLMHWLAPDSTCTTITVPVPQPTGAPLPVEDGIVSRGQLLAQALTARAHIEQHAPERIAVFGGDCLVDLAPFAYLSRRYGDAFGVLWIDAHPDVMTPQQFPHAHAMVLGHLMGQGDPQFARQVARPVPGARVMYAGLGATSDFERDFIARHDIRVAPTDRLATDSSPVTDWIREHGIRHLAIHLDLDVLDPRAFGALYFNDPSRPPSDFDGITRGTMTVPHLMRLIADVDAATDIVGLGITEFMPWAALQMRDMLARMPVFRD